jgi:hypothetical protein
MRTILFITLAIILINCSGGSDSREIKTGPVPGIMLADTISYPVVIKNPDTTDTWTTECLLPLDRKKLVDMVFDAVYKHKAQAYKYFDDKPMSISEIKDLEKTDEFSRDRVGKLQFWESWYFDEKHQIFTKKVHKILVAYELFTEDGELRNYKAAFYIKLN